MSRYEPLWRYIKNSKASELALTFAEAEKIMGFTLDHAFLNRKKELEEYGWQVKKISLKERTIAFEKKADGSFGQEKP